MLEMMVVQPRRKILVASKIWMASVNKQASGLRVRKRVESKVGEWNIDYDVLS